VYNEQAGINATVDHVLSSAGEWPVEVIVSDGGPGGQTLAAIEHPEVLKVESRPGRGPQMNAGAAMATGDVLLFLHADTRLPDDWAGLVSATLNNDVVAGAFSLFIDSDRASLGLVAFFANLRSRWERVPYGDQGHFFRANFFRDIGGYAMIPLMEDVELFKRIRRLGENVVILSESVQTSSRRWESEGVLKRTLSNWWLRIRYGFGSAPHKLVAGYRPPKEGNK